jgi:adenylate cyclase
LAPPFKPGRRFFATFGYSLLQAAIFGSTVAALLYFRAPRVTDEEGEAIASHAVASARQGLEWMESGFYDWRARALGRESSRSDSDVAIVAVDEESLANARRGDQALLAQRPWPRQVLGALVERILSEGALLVVIDLPLWDASPSCGPATDDPSAGSDDDSFRAALDKHPGKTVLGFIPRDEAAPAVLQTRPYLALLEHRPSSNEARESVRRILAERRPAYVIQDGPRVAVWAGVRTEEEGRSLIRGWDPKAPLTIRELTPPDRASEISPVELLVSQAAVEVEGLDPTRVPRARSLEVPFAPLIGTRSGFGGVALPPDPDGDVRGVQHLVNYAPREGQVRLLPSAVLEAAMRLAGKREVRYRSGRLFVGDRYSIPVDGGGFGLVRWEAEESAKDARGPLKRLVPAWRLLVNLEDARHGLPPHYRNDLEGRVVILEDATLYSTDRVSTPIGAGVPGGTVLAQSLVNLLKSDGVERVDPKWDAVAAFALAFLGAFLALTFATSLRTPGGLAAYLLAVAAVASVYLYVAHQSFVEDRLWLSVAGPLTAMALTTFFSMAYALRMDRRFREFLHASLGHNLSQDTIRLLGQDPELLHPDRRQVTVLRVRIEGFSVILERATPEKIAGLLQEYLYEVTQAVHAAGGQIDKHLGDETIAFWGAPVRTDRHPHLGCETALELMRRLERGRAEWNERYGHDVEIRIGLESGEALVGDLGSDAKSNYTVLGDAVRMSGRLCGETKRYGARILVGEGTARVATDEFAFREVDRIRPPGSTLPSQIFELWGARSSLDDAAVDHLARYEHALVAYHERRFEEALELMQKCATERNDPIAALYTMRCAKLLQRPPPGDWDGVWTEAEAPPPPPAASAKTPAA